MEPTTWLKQSADKPLFEDVMWLRPENPHQRPKVLIIGGSSHGFVNTTKLYEAIKSKSAYQTRVMLPDSLEKMLGHALDDAVFVASTSSGEISLEAKNEIRPALEWAEAVIFSDDLGNNSQTEILITDLYDKIDKSCYFLGHSIELLIKSAENVAQNPNVNLVGDLHSLSKFNSATSSTTALLQGDGLVMTVNKLQTISQKWQATIATKAESQLVVANHGSVSTTKNPKEEWITDYVAQSVQFAKSVGANDFKAQTTAAYLCSV